jgi:TolB protein
MRFAARSWSRIGVAIALASISVGWHTGLAGASHPGRNGRIAFESYRTYGGVPELLSIDPDGSDLRRLTRNRGGDAFPTYTPDGRAIVFESCRPGGCGVFSMSHEGGAVARLRAVPSEAAEVTSSRSAVAFSSRLDGNLYVVDLRTGRRRRLAGGRRSTILEPDFSPSGDRIAFVRGVPGGGPLLYTIGRDGTGRRRLTARGSRAPLRQPAFSPDGGRLAVVRRGPLPDGECCDHDVWVIDADGGGLRRVTHDAAEEWAPVFSPDGRQIAFGSYAAGRWSISVVDVDEGRPREVTQGDVVGGPPNPDWQPLP